jgi:hypothetical protein
MKMAKNKGFTAQSGNSKNSWVAEKKADQIFEGIPVDKLDVDKLEATAATTEELLELEAKKILKYNQQKNLGYIMDAQYHFNVFFLCKEDKEEFFAKLGITDIADIYINGYELAKKLGINIEKKLIHLPKPKALLI